MTTPFLLALPIVENNLANKNPDSTEQIWLLQDLGEKAKPDVPLLLEAPCGEDRICKARMGHTLRRIDPKALTKQV